MSMSNRETIKTGRMIMAALLMTLLGATGASGQIDFGDHKSETLTAKAWQAMGSGDLASALIYAEKCVSMYEGEALKMQASLGQLPPNETQEDVFRRWALNDVGTCLFIKGEALAKKGDSAGAKAAYEKCATFKFAQCWDPKGWFWRPADAAKQKALEIGFDAQ